MRRGRHESRCIHGLEQLEPRRLMAVTAGFAETLFTSGVSRPTAMAFAPDGRLFVSQKDGNLRIVNQFGTLLPTPFAQLPVHDAGERGLIGVAFDPNFTSNPYVYVYYTHNNGAGGYHNRVSRLTATGDVALLGSEQVLIEGEPLGDTGHNGGGLHFGADGKLYVTTGENRNAAAAARTDNLLGKVLRINPDGSIPTDNPFYNQTTGKNQAIWAVGLRNPFAFAVQPGTGRIFINDVGGERFEEVNEGRPGANYGWPAAEGPSTDPAYDTPFYAYEHLTNAGADASITGAAFYNPPSVTFPADHVGDYFFSDYSQNWIRRLDLETKTVSEFVSGADQVIDVDVAADGSLYYLTRAGEGRVYRVAPASGTGPTVTVPPQDLTVGIGQAATFTVEAAGGDGALSYQWQRNGVDIPGATGASYTVPAAAVGDSGAAFQVVVSGAGGFVTSSPATLTVINNNAPTATITLPAAGSLWRGGAPLTFSGTASDPEDGVLPPSAFTWEVVFHHATHTHPFVVPYSGVTGDTITLPDTGETAADVWYRVNLTVRDSAGLTHSTSVDVRPETVNLALATEPAGLQLTMDGQPVATPYGMPAVVGMRRSLGAPASQTVGGVVYDFVSWSDGGAATHEIATPGASTTFTAVYQPRTAGNPGENPGGGGDPPGNPPPNQADLAVQSVEVAGAAVIGRAGGAAVRVGNRGSVAFSGAVNVNLFLSPDPSLNDGDTPVASFGKKLKIKPGATGKPLKVKFAVPGVPSDGGYYLLARVSPATTPADANPANDVGASAGPVAVRNPVVDLAGSFAAPPKSTVSQGGKAAVAVNLLNAGTEAVSGPLSLLLYAVPEGAGPDAPRTTLAAMTKSFTINPGQAKRLNFAFTVPADLARGRYSLVVLIDTAGAFTEPDESNNSVAPVPLIVT